MQTIGLASALVVVVFGIVYFLREWYVREAATGRLVRQVGGDNGAAAAPNGFLSRFAGGPAPLVERYHWACWLVGIGVFLLLLFFRPIGFGALTTFVFLAVAAVVLLILLQLEVIVAEGRLAKMEAALANAIDLMVSSLRSGASIIDAIDTAGREIGGPLGSVTHDILTRIRYGDNPQKVLVRFADRVPLDSFRLFATTLAVNWDTGGALSPSLAAVGRSVRDRIEIRRRMRALTVHTWLTMMVLFAISYILLYVMVAYRPEHVLAFIANPIGAAMFLAVILLQALGFVWLTSLSRVKF